MKGFSSLMNQIPLSVLDLEVGWQTTSYKQSQTDLSQLTGIPVGLREQNFLTPICWKKLIIHDITSLFWVSGAKIRGLVGEPENGHLADFGRRQRFLDLNLCTKMHLFACGHANLFLVRSCDNTGLNLGFGWVSMHLAWSHAWIMHFLAMFHCSDISIT